MKLFKKGQGATEYLLMLAAVLVIVAIAVYYVTSTTPSALITGTAENRSDNIVFTPSSEMTPSSIPAADWEYCVYSSAGTQIAPASGWTAGTGTLARGTPIKLSSLAGGGGDSGDILKIRYKGDKVFNITIA
ncbi:MAG: class III signal peptide-containing protein [Hadesarchaea archaeon]|nr:class III signal peptide-containing protein [Hadesarchaea archaeon]